MAYSNNVKFQAVQLRRKGYSLKEIGKEFGIAKSTVALWVRDVILDEMAEKRLLTIIKRGQLISARNKRIRTQAKEDKYFREAREEFRINPNYNLIICSMIYWCEGAKNPREGIAFTNSDPNLVRKFLKLLRECFDLDEAKFRVCIHLHSYHNPEIQLDFWSKVTDIDKRQFMKPFLKGNTGKRIHVNYQGCISLRYYNNDLARRLMATAKAFLDQTGA